MKQRYQEPTIELEEFVTEDIMAESGNPDLGGGIDGDIIL